MDVEVIGVDKDGLAHDVGAGIFGYNEKNSYGSLGRSAFVAPKVYANRLRQGIFWEPYAYKSYEAEEPEMKWALERRPGLPLFPGSSARGLVMVGPAMGSTALPSAAPLVGAALIACGLLGLGALWWGSDS